MNTILTAQSDQKRIRLTVSKTIDPALLPLSVSGWKQIFIQCIIWLHILFICIQTSGIKKGVRSARLLRKIRDRYREKPLQKYQLLENKISFNFNAPSWPSHAFKRYIRHLLHKTDQAQVASLHTLVFAITKKCGFQCEHCCEWENLNKPEQLSRENIAAIVNRFYELGISQLHLSGGEPLNRFADILYLLENKPAGLDVWIYTTGYQLNKTKAKLLEYKGLTGLVISIDHHDPVQHDIFRGREGAFERAIQAAHFAREAGLSVTFSICATKSFITEANLMAYAKMAQQNGASFIQILEPKAVGHYAGMDVTLAADHILLLEQFFEKMNYDKGYSDYPLVSYHGYYSRRAGCAGSGNDYLYVDTDGDIHSCPFCQKKLFSAFTTDLSAKIIQLKNSGCGLFRPDTKKILQ
jgi:MoaA/NifB/PqqE/SkfB family radical SAM enzyme